MREPTQERQMIRARDCPRTGSARVSGVRASATGLRKFQACTCRASAASTGLYSLPPFLRRVPRRASCAAAAESPLTLAVPRTYRTCAVQVISTLCSTFDCRCQLRRKPAGGCIPWQIRQAGSLAETGAQGVQLASLRNFRAWQKPPKYAADTKFPWSIHELSLHF